MAEENSIPPDARPWGLGNKSESLLDAPKMGWGENMMSKKDREKIDPISDLGKFAAQKDAKSKDREALDRQTHLKQREEGLKFTAPVKSEAGMPPVLKGKFPRVEATEETSNGVDCDWRVTSVEGGWTVGDGNFHDLNANTSELILSTTVVGEAGLIYFHIERDPASRAITSKGIEFYVEVPISSESDQYIEIAAVGGTPSIIQKQFTPIRVYEDLFVINGEFRFGSIAMLADTLYELPAP